MSSTFSDLVAERNALQREVWPRLRELCQAHGCRFQAIDLRWGIREEAALDQRTMPICLEELRRCQVVSPRPNFVVLLGDRYGWRPAPYEIAADEFERLLEHVTTEERRLLAWDDPLPDGGGWYRLDANAAPPAYVLQPRTGEFADPGAWAGTERRLRTTLLQAAEQAGLCEGARTKYHASATEQEILAGALSVEDAGSHVFCFFREFANAPTGDRAGLFVDLGDGVPETHVRHALAQLKERLAGRLPGNVETYGAEWSGDGASTGHIGKLCDDVYERLSRVMLDEIAGLEAADSLDAENEAHEAFARERARLFVGREAPLAAIAEYLAGEGPYLLVLHGESGSGKSALMACALAQAREAHPEALVLSRFIGATPASSDGRSLLEELCRQLGQAYGAEAETPDYRELARDSEWVDRLLRTYERQQNLLTSPETQRDYRELVREFLERLGLATAERPLVLFLDALDQISDANNARYLTWLPGELPEHVHLVVSCPPHSCLAILERKAPQGVRHGLDAMTEDERRGTLDLRLAEAGRTLQPAQRAYLEERLAQCPLPLYIKLATEEARLWRSYDPPLTPRPHPAGEGGGEGRSPVRPET